MLTFLRALIEREDENQPSIRLDLFDNGSGPDFVANDGIYTRYFTNYNGKNGRYSLKCQVKANENTGFIVQKGNNANKGIISNPNEKTYPLVPGEGASPICCGSSSGNDVETKNTGNFTRRAAGLSFKVKHLCVFLDTELQVLTLILPFNQYPLFL